MNLECWKCNEFMNELEEEQGDWTVKYYQCPTCDCKVSKVDEEISNEIQ